MKRGDYIQRERMAAIYLMGARCAACGDTNISHLHIHHVYPVNQGGNRQGRGSAVRVKNLVLDVMKHNTVLLCEWCHEDLHKRNVLFLAAMAATPLLAAAMMPNCFGRKECRHVQELLETNRLLSEKLDRIKDLVDTD